MELLYQWRFFALRVLASALLLWLCLRVAQLDTIDPYRLALYVFAFAGITINIYDTVVYPYLLDPLRKHPTVTIVDFRELLPVTNAPRGEKTLQWITKHPGADLINVVIYPGTRALIPVSAQAHRDVLQTYGADFEKPEAGANFLAEFLGRGLILAEGEAHRRQRRVITPSFKIQNIRSLHPLIAEKTSLMFKGIDQEMSAKGFIEITSWGSRVTLDIIGPAFMSKDFQSLITTESDLEKAYHNLIASDSGRTFLFIMSFMMPQWLVRRIPTPTNRIMHSSADFIRSVCAKILDEKVASRKAGGVIVPEEEATNDILGSIMNNGEFSYQELIDQMLTFLGAGHETTASSIAWATHLLTLPQYSRYQALLRDEIANAVESHHKGSTPLEGQEILPYGVLESLPMLNGICEETLRLYPPVTNTGRKATRDTSIAGNKIVKGTLITISPWATNRNPEFWGPTAGDMVPERWIDQQPDGTRRVNKHGGAPSNLSIETFLHGNRSCIGRDFAKAELRYILAATFWRYEAKRLPGDDGTIVPSGSLTIKPEGGLHVSLVPWKENATVD